MSVIVNSSGFKKEGLRGKLALSILRKVFIRLVRRSLRAKLALLILRCLLGSLGGA